MEFLHRAQRDRLLSYIDKSDFAQNILKHIERKGYVVLPEVVSREEADREYDRMWNFVETVSRGVCRSDSSTWQKSSGYDPWPMSQRDMMQLHQAGWVFSDLREVMAERVFEKLYGTRELHTSKDGFTLQRPTEAELGRSPNDHFDQGCKLKGLQCIQGSVALTDQEYEDGCFLCWPGSHQHHEELVAKRPGGGARKDWVILNENEKQFLNDHGVQPVRVPVRKGDVVLWRSDVAHKGAPPIGKRDNFRGVVYICMLPAVLTPEEVYEQKQQAYQKLETGSHWPCQEEWFSPRKAPQFDLQPYFRKPPALTERQSLLYGLRRYNGASPLLSSQMPSSSSCQILRLAMRSREERGSKKWTSPIKPAVEFAEVQHSGLVGDYNHYRTTAKKSTNDRAVSLMTMGALQSLQKDGYDVGPGDLGENLTIGAAESLMEVGLRLRVVDAAGEPGSLELELTEKATPCGNLEWIPSIASLPEKKRRAFPRACKGRRGWYARVIQDGAVKLGNSLQLRCAGSADLPGCEISSAAKNTNGEVSNVANKTNVEEKDSTAAPSQGPRVRRWQRKATQSARGEG